jgi:hypothetical protein
VTHIDVSEKIDGLIPLCGRRYTINETFYYSNKDKLAAFDKADLLTCSVCSDVLKRVKAGQTPEEAVADAVSIAASDCPRCGRIKTEPVVCCH